MLYEIEGIDTTVSYIENIALYCFPLFLIIQLIIHLVAKNSDLFETVKYYLIALLIVGTLPTYYKSITHVGIEIGDSIANLRNDGFVSEWKNIRKNAEIEAKGKRVTNISIILGMFVKFGTLQIAEKMALLLIGVALLFLQLIYTVSYYSGYVMAPIIIAIGVLNQYRNNLYTVFKTVMYLIICPIVVGIMLFVLNMILFYTIKDGYISGFEGLISFLVLSIVLLSSFKIANMIVSGQSMSNVGDSLASMASFGIMRGGTELGIGMAKKGAGAMAKTAIATGGPVAAPFAAAGMGALYATKGITKGIGKAFATPPKHALKEAKQGASSYLNTRATNLLKDKGIETPYSGDPLIPSNVQTYKEPEKFDYDSSYKKNMEKIREGSGSSREGSRISSSFNPINHVKASVSTMSDGLKNSRERSSFNLNNKLGIPQKSDKPLSLADKAVFIGNKIAGNSTPGTKASFDFQKTNQRMKKINPIAKELLKKNKE